MGKLKLSNNGRDMHLRLADSRQAFYSCCWLAVLHVESEPCSSPCLEGQLYKAQREDLLV